MKASGMALAALLALALPGAAGAATITVNTTTDTLAANLCSLREAISAVNAPGTQVADCTVAHAGADTIVLGAGDYQLSRVGADETANLTGDLNVFGTVSGLTVVGAGADATSIDATGLGDRVLNIAAGATVTLRDLAITGGFAPSGQDGADGASSSIRGGAAGGAGGSGENGGGVLNTGTLTLDRVTVTGNRAGNGGRGGKGGASTSSNGNGGLGGSGGGGGDGGGIYNAGTLTLTDSTVSGNNSMLSFDGAAGGSAGQGGNSSGATAGAGGSGGEGGSGGGIYSAGALTIAGSTIDDNGAGDGGTAAAGGSGFRGGGGGIGGSGGSGAGIASLGGSLSITNSTIVDNDTFVGGTGGAGGASDNDLQPGGNGGNGGAGGDGGGLDISTAGDSFPLLLNVTVADNQVGGPSLGGAGANAGGLQGENGSPGAAGVGGGVADLDVPLPGHGGVLLQNTLVASNGASNCTGSLTILNGGHDLSFGDDTCPGSTGDPDLSPLRNNGGATETMALGAGSAAIDAVPASGAGCPSTDQRGALRPAGAACDIGAYELATPGATTGPPNASSGTSATVTGTAFNPDVAPGSAYFQYGLSAAYGAASGVEPVPTTSMGAQIGAVLTGLSPGTTYHYRLLVANATGTVFGADRTFTTATTTGAPGTPGPAGGSRSGTPRPKIADLRITPDRFARKRGATVTYKLNEAAVTTFWVLRPTAGRVHGHACTAPHRASRGGKPCVRWVRVGRAFTHRGVAGKVAFRLASALAAGAYRLQATPHAGGRAGNTVTSGFTVLTAGRYREPSTGGQAR